MKKIILISLMLAGCSGGGGDSTPPPSFSLDSFTSSKTSLDPAIDSGAFTVSWSATSNNGLTLRLYISQDAVISGQDIDFYYEANPGLSGSMSCGWQSDNTLFCDLPAFGEDLSTWLTGLPMGAVIIAEGCDYSTLNCDTIPINVTLQ